MSIRLQRLFLIRVYVLITLISLFVIFISRGPIEGDARNSGDYVPTSDWYGPIPPLLYGHWPFSGENWDFSLSLVQVLFFCIGFFLLLDFRRENFGLLISLLQLGAYWVGIIFSSQLWRDATLLSFTIIGIGFIKFAISATRLLKICFFSIGFFFVLIGACCKFIYSPIIALLILLFVGREIFLTKKIFASFVLIFTFVSLAPFFLSQLVSTSLGLQKSFPEQQPVIFDLTSIYCWGSSLESNQLAIEYLRITKKQNYPDPSICSSLEPSGWDTLRTDRPLWQYSSPLRPLANEKKVKELIRNWLTLILKHPQEYIEVKIIHSTQVVTMANAIGPRWERSNSLLQENPMIFQLSNFLTIPAQILDKSRIFSLGFLLILTITCLLRFSFTDQTSLSSALRKEPHLFLLALLLVFQLTLTTLSFVSSNGRYTFPFILISLIYLLNIINEKKYLEIKA